MIHKKVSLFKCTFVTKMIGNYLNDRKAGLKDISFHNSIINGSIIKNNTIEIIYSMKIYLRIEHISFLFFYCKLSFGFSLRIKDSVSAIYKQ